MIMKWETYANLSGDSGVTRYAIGDDLIAVEFRSGDFYTYDSVQPGSNHVEHMKELAIAGRGLATYISQHVRRSYARKNAL